MVVPSNRARGSRQKMMMRRKFLLNMRESFTVGVTRVAQGDCGVFLTEGIPVDTILCHVLYGDPAWAGRLDR